jgi:hypothetical protein
VALGFPSTPTGTAATQDSLRQESFWLTAPWGNVGHVGLTPPLGQLTTPSSASIASVVTKDTNGLWLLGVGGGVFRPAIGLVPTPDPRGWLVAADGAVFPSGDTRSPGSPA